MLQEPLILIGTFFLLFLAVMAYVRIDIVIGTHKRAGSSDALARLLDEARDIAERRQDLHEALDRALDKALQQTSSASYDSDRRGLEIKFSKLGTEFSRVVGEVEAHSREVAQALKELEKIEKIKKDAHVELHKLELSSKIGKAVNKSDYEAQKANQEQQYDNADDDISSILDDLA